MLGDVAGRMGDSFLLLGGFGRLPIRGRLLSLRAGGSNLSDDLIDKPRPGSRPLLGRHLTLSVRMLAMARLADHLNDIIANHACYGMIQEQFTTRAIVIDF